MYNNYYNITIVIMIQYKKKLITAKVYQIKDSSG